MWLHALMRLKTSMQRDTQVSFSFKQAKKSKLKQAFVWPPLRLTDSGILVGVLGVRYM